MKQIYLTLISQFVLLTISAQSFERQVQQFISVNDSSFAITNVTLIDGTGNPTQKNQTIVIKDNAIVAIGDTSSTSVPSTMKTIDGTGKTIMPGLVMLHEHMFYTKPFENWFSVGQMTFTFPRLYLAGGVTSMRTAGSIQPRTALNVM